MNENQNEVKNEKKNGCLAEAKRFWSGIGQQFKEHKMLKVVAGTAIGVVGAAAVTVAGVLVVKKIKGKAEEGSDVIVELPAEGGSSDTEA